MFRLTSFSRSFLWPVASDRPSLRRVFRVFRAARRRWPSGSVRVVRSPYSRVPSVHFVVDGCVGVSLHWATFGPRA